MDYSQILQLQLRPNIIDLGWGHPDMQLLPHAQIQSATNAALQRWGGVMLTYGIDHGVAPLRAQIADWIAQHEQVRPRLDEIMLSAGNSQASASICTMLTQPGDVILVENPSYHLALRILRDAPVVIRGIPCDHEGVDVDTLSAVLRECQQAGQRVAFFYTIPTFQNPTGTSLSPARRQQLAQVVANSGLRIVEDDVYRELWYEHVPAPSLWPACRSGSVIRLGSFAKSLAPGLRLGYISADAATIQRLAGSGLLDSGGGIAHFQSLIVSEIMSNGDFADIVSRYRQWYGSRCHALHTALLPLQAHGYQWYRPTGGYFLWMRLPDGSDEKVALARLEARGVSGLPCQLFSQGRSVIPPCAFRLVCMTKPRCTTLVQ
jgi:DNA-binding transcriptional MocR family regulator